MQYHDEMSLQGRDVSASLTSMMDFSDGKQWARCCEQ